MGQLLGLPLHDRDMGIMGFTKQSIIYIVPTLQFVRGEELSLQFCTNAMAFNSLFA